MTEWGQLQSFEKLRDTSLIFCSESSLLSLPLHLFSSSSSLSSFHFLPIDFCVFSFPAYSIERPLLILDSSAPINRLCVRKSTYSFKLLLVQEKSKCTSNFTLVIDEAKALQEISSSILENGQQN